MREQDTITCEQAELLLHAYADGELNSQERAAVQAHLDGCPSCRAALDEIEAMSTLLAQAAERPSPALRARVLRAISEEGRGNAPRVPMWRRWGTVAAAFACVFVVAMALFAGGILDDVGFAADEDMAMAPDAAPQAPMESVPSDERVEDWWADEDAADDVTDNLLDVTPPADIAPEGSTAGDKEYDAPSSTGGEKPSLAKSYTLKRVGGDGQIGGLSLGEMLDGEWASEELFLSFARHSGELKLEWRAGDVRMGRFSLDGDILTITLEDGEVLLFRAWVEEGCLCLIPR